MSMRIHELIREFAEELTGELKSEIDAEIKRAVDSTLVGVVEQFVSTTKRTGQATKEVSYKGYSRVPAIAPIKIIAPRKKAPPQLCPVPGCRQRAAPVFGMVCKKHKGVSKATIKKYRQSRAAKKGKR